MEGLKLRGTGMFQCPSYTLSAVRGKSPGGTRGLH